jgi:hypothetical protein
MMGRNTEWWSGTSIFGDWSTGEIGGSVEGEEREGFGEKHWQPENTTAPTISNMGVGKKRMKGNILYIITRGKRDYEGVCDSIRPSRGIIPDVTEIIESIKDKIAIISIVPVRL